MADETGCTFGQRVVCDMRSRRLCSGYLKAVWPGFLGAFEVWPDEVWPANRLRCQRHFGSRNTHPRSRGPTPVQYMIGVVRKCSTGTRPSTRLSTHRASSHIGVRGDRCEPAFRSQHRSHKLAGSATCCPNLALGALLLDLSGLRRSRHEYERLRIRPEIVGVRRFLAGS